MLLSKLRYVLAYGLELTTRVPAVLFLVFWIKTNLYRASELLSNAFEAFEFFCVAIIGLLGIRVVCAISIWQLVLFFSGKLNGVPFHEGVWVRILRGPHRDCVVRVYEIWSTQGQVRVEIGEQEKKEFKDVFKYNEVCLESKFSSSNQMK
jgi:hypothetical protein